jgi:hypothetical protein
MKKLTCLLGLSVLLFAPVAPAQVGSEEIDALRAQIDALTRRLDELERQNRELTQAQQASQTAAPAAVDAEIEQKVDAAVAEQIDERMAGLSWAERLRWEGDFRYRYENIAEDGKADRNRSRIRARTHLEADVTPTVKVGIGLATGGDDPVSANVTLGGGGSRKDIDLDLAYFDWTGLKDTHITGGKVKNFLVRPAKTGLLWDSDWRPEGIGARWDNGAFFAQGLGTWLEGDSNRGGTQFSWVLQGGMNLQLGETGKLRLGGGYSQFDIAGRTPLFGDPEDFYGNSFVQDPATGDLVFKYDYRQIELFAEYGFKLGGKSIALFADYTQNQDADDNDTGYLIGAKFGSAKKKGQWDIGYFYEKIEADATVGLLTDSDFGGGGTDAKGHVLTGTYAFHDNWNFKATYFINEIRLSSGNPRDFDRLMLDLNFSFD